MDNNLPDLTKLSLGAAIERGKQLQKEKPSNLNNKPSLHVLNDKVPCGKKHQYNRSRPRNKNPALARTAPARSSHTARTSPMRGYVVRSTSPCFVVNPGSPRSSVSSNNRRKLKCPLRIAELAVPTKRHCIETWRARNDVLPDFMLDRLKQLVMNQKVVATVPDAVQCFKCRRGKDSSPSSKRSDTRSRNLRRSVRQNQNIDDIKIMCAVFCQSIAGRLIKNKNNFENCLSDDLEKLSTVVAHEIKKLIQNRKSCADYVYNIDLLKEMSGKITMWIVDILGESRFNMLEDELKVQKDRENRMGKEGNLETLIDQYIGLQMGERCSSRFIDLEEEEGPALDAIDTLVENVLDICIIKDSDSIDLLSRDSIDLLSREEEPSMDDVIPDETHPEMVSLDEDTSESDQATKYEELDTKDEQLDTKDEQLDTKDEQLDTKDEQLDEKYEESDSVGRLWAPEITVANNIPVENGVYNISEKLEQDNEDSDSQYDSTADVESTDSKTMIVETADDDNDTNVSDVSVTLEESLDDRKKVKFSHVKDDGTNEFGPLGAENILETEVEEPEPQISNQSLKNWPNYSNSATLIRPDIVFQPPNPSILSVADESWPDDYINHVLKPSASVSKSITSLGEIKEVDEPEQHGRTVIKNDEYCLSSNDANTTSSTQSEEIDKHSLKIKTLDGERSISLARASFERVTPSKLLGELKALLEGGAVQLRERDIKKDKGDVNDIDSYQGASAGKGDHIQDQNLDQDDTDTDQNPIVEAIKEKLRHEYQAKFDYRVHPQTAPSWAITSPSEDSEPIFGKERPFEPDELRKWCKDIEHTLINLDQWNKWIDFTCKQILYMKHQTVASSKLAPHERTCVLAGWTKLKKCIDKDAILWRKLNDRTLQVLKTYSRKPKSRKNSPLRLQNKKRIKKEESISETMLIIDGMSTWLHRSIVSTEHIVKCNCRNILSRPQTSTLTKKQRKKL